MNGQNLAKGDGDRIREAPDPSYNALDNEATLGI